MKDIFFIKELPQLSKFPLIMPHYYIILMSDIQQMNHFGPPRPNQSGIAETEAFINRLPQMKEVLECSPDHLFENIQKLSLLTEAERKLIKKEATVVYARITKALNQQLKKVTDWNIDHEKLYGWLTKIGQFIGIDIKTIYKTTILANIQNGLIFINLLGKISQSPTRMRGRLDLPQMSTISVLQNCYKVTRTTIHQEDPDYLLYNKRFNCLNTEQKMKYRIKLLKHLISIPSLPQMPHLDPMNPAPLIPFYHDQKKEECLEDVQSFYKQLETAEYEWLLEELMEIDCKKTAEFKKIISCLDLIQQENQEKEVILSACPKINSRLLTKNVLKKCFNVQRQSQSNLLSEGNILEANSRVYLKYDITQLLDVTIDYIGPLAKISRGMGNQISINQQPFKKNLFNTIQKLYLLIKQANNQKPILVYEDYKTFNQIPSQKLFEVAQFCIKMLSKIIQLGMIVKVNNIISEMLITPELIIHLNMVMAMIVRHQNQEKGKEIFINICRILQELVIKNQEKMLIMKNKQFLNIFIENINKALSDETLKAIPRKIQSFLISYIPKLFEYGLQVQKLNLARIYELELNNLSNSRPKLSRLEMGRMRISRMERLDNDFEQMLRESESNNRDKLEQFIEAFPGCIPYFSERLSASIDSVQKQLTDIDVFNGSSPQLQSLLKLFVSQKIVSNEGLSTLFKKLLHQHPSIFVKASSTVNFTALKNKLNVKEEQISASLLGVHAKLNQELAVESVSAQELCESMTTSNKQMIELANMISHLNLLLKMRQKNPAFPFVKELLEISMIMEKIESISLNKIVKYQAEYSNQKLKAIREYYKEIGDGKILYYTIAQNSKLLSQTTWAVFQELDLPQTNILLREYRIYFERMKNLQDKNLVLRLMKKTFRNLGHLSSKNGINLNFQLYNHNREAIVQALGFIHKQISQNKRISRETTVMGSSYLRFIQRCREQNKDAAKQFNIIIVPHIQESVTELIDFLFFRIQHSRSIFNSREYRGQQNTINLVRSICCDVIKRIGKNFDLSSLSFYKKFIHYIEVKGLSPLRTQAEQQRLLEIQQPIDSLLPISKDEKQKVLAEAYIKILDQIYEHRYSKSHLNDLQTIFCIIVQKLNQKYKIQNQQHKLLTSILYEISQNSEINDEIFKTQCSWIDNILGKIKNFKFENVVSVDFITKYQKLIALMLNNPEQYKESIPNSIIILEKLVPKSYSEDRLELIAYARPLLELISKVINGSITFKKVNLPIISNITSALINSKCPQFNKYIQRFLDILSRQNTNIGPLLSELIERQSHLPSMQADIKGVFLKESQNLVDQSQDKISIRLSTFINIFKYKYSEDVAAFTNLASKLVKKNIQNDGKKEQIYLSYEKRNSFSYSQLLKKDFNKFQPSENIKTIIRDLFKLSSNNNLKYKLESFRDLFYYSPLMIPYVMLHPIKTPKGDVEFIDYLVTQISSKMSENISNFILFICLDHSCMAQLKDRTIFFSEYLCYRIIKQIMKIGINKYTLILTYTLSQLKRFAYLCKIKLDNNDKISLATTMIRHLKASRQGFLYKSGQNNIIYLILAIIYKQDGIDNLKKCFIPKRNKQFDRQYKIINESLIPFHAYFRKMKDGKLQSREENIAFTGNLITPFYSQICEDIFMDQDYKCLGEINYKLEILYKQEEIVEFQGEKLQNHHLKALTSVKTTKKYESAIRQLMTEINERHRVTISQIYKVYFKGQNSLEDRENAQIQDQEQFIRQQRAFGRRAHHLRVIDQFERPGRRGRGRGRNGREMNRRNRPHMSRYAQEDFSNNTQSSQRNENKTIEKQFEQSLNIIPSEEIIHEEVSSSNFEDIKTGEEQLEQLLYEINEKFQLLGKEPLNLNEIKGQNFAEKKQFLELKDIQLDFDYHKKSLPSEQFQQYCLMYAHRFQKLDPERREQIRLAEESMYILNLQRSRSSDSIGHIIDTIDVNYQYLNIPRTLSRSESLSSQGDNIQHLQEENFLFENSEIPLRAFSDIQEETLYEMLLSFYYVCETLAGKSFMPFLQNKKSQNKLINTLLYLMKDPFNCKYFPNCIYRLPATDLVWKQVPITQSNLKEQHQKFIERVLIIFESVKNYSFHQDEQFLLTQIGNEGIFDIKYEPIIKLTGQNTYRPIYELLQYGFSTQTKSIMVNLLNGVKQLPENKIDQIIQIIQKSEAVVETGEQQHAFVMGRVYAVPRRSSNTFPYENLKELYKNQSFKTKFKQIYIFGTKSPTPALLIHLIQSGIFTSQELKIFQLQFLASGQDDPRTLMFLNKVVQIYTDQELKQAKWIKQYRQTISKVLDYLSNSSAQLDKEPISRIFNLTNDLGFQIKRAIFEREITERKRAIDIDFDQIQKRQVTARLQKGIFESAFEDLRNKPDNFWLSPFNIRFINENGKKESGFGDGVRRQWFTLLSKSMVNLNYALFNRTPKNNYFFNRESDINPRHLQYFEFIGKIIGFSLSKSTLFVSPSLSILIYKMMLGEQITVEDIFEDFEDEASFVKSIQTMIEQIKSKEDFQAVGVEIPFVYVDKRLLSTQKYTLGNGKQISINTSAKTKKIYLQESPEKVIKQLHNEQEQKNLPESVNITKVNEVTELKPGGSEIFVTFDTMHEYLQLFKEKIYELAVDSVKRQFNAFMAGFKRIINPKLISRFTAKQLKLLVEGVNTISIDDLQRHSKADLDSTTASLLWSTLEGLSNEDRGVFLWNWTGVDKMAAEGARIMGLRLSPARGPYFIAHTCSKNLQVPNCQTKLEMDTAVTVVLNNVKSGKAIIED